MKNNVSTKKGFRLRFGWATTIAVIVAFGILISGRLMRPAPPDPFAGKIVMEAGPDGKLHRVNSPSFTVRKTPKLMKWEVGDLIAHASQLGLSASQLEKLRGFNTQWINEKSALILGMRRAMNQAKPQASESMAKLTMDLAGYSRLSDHFAERRNYYLRQGLAILQPQQAVRWVSLEQRDQKGR